MSTDTEILNYLRGNSRRLSYMLPASKFFTKKIRTYQKHLNSLFDFWLREENYNLSRRAWKEDVQHFLEHIHLPFNEDYISLEVMYVRLTKETILRAIQGEKSDFVEEKQDECHVCCDEIKDHLSCGHYVCKKCIINSGRETCPLCRKTVSLSLEEVKSVDIFKKKLKREREEEERRQLLSQHERTEEHLINMMSNSIAIFDNNVVLRPLSLSMIRTWLRMYESNNYSRDNQVYIESIRRLTH